MGYELRAVIADDAILRAASRDLRAARPAPLGQGLSLMPMTDGLFALRRLGVVAGAGEDEFSAVGLGRHRYSEKWIA